MEKRNYEKLLKAGNQAQLVKLKMNEEKGGWNNLSFGQLFVMLQEELNELEKEIDNHHQDTDLIRLEAADIANYAHMIIQKCDKVERLRGTA